jgi:hypothetical protein
MSGAQLLDWQRIDKGALVGRAKVLLPNGLEIADIAVFAKEHRRWATLPAEPMRDRDGQVLKNADGKIKYRSLLKWRDKALQDAFSEKIIALIEGSHGPIGGAQ